MPLVTVQISRQDFLIRLVGIHCIVDRQIRTIAMDFWASLEHDIHYKADRAKLPAGIDEEMFACAEKIAEIDQQMQDMYRRIADAEANGDAAKK